MTPFWLSLFLPHQEPSNDWERTRHRATKIAKNRLRRDRREKRSRALAREVTWKISALLEAVGDAGIKKTVETPKALEIVRPEPGRVIRMGFRQAV